MSARTVPEVRACAVMAPPRARRTLRERVAYAVDRDRLLAAARAGAPFALVFVAYVAAGLLGQATTSIRSSNLGPVWPAYGIALAAGLKYGYRIWPALAASAFLIAVQGSVSTAAAAGQAVGATLGALTGTFLLQRIPGFDPSLPRLRDALAFIGLGAFGSAVVSSAIGVFSLFATGIQAYSGLPAAWLVYWLGDSTGVLLVTPLVFARLVQERPSRAQAFEFATLITLLSVACFVIFGNSNLFSIRTDILAFAVLPFVMWGAIGLGVGGATLTVFWTAALATVLTALGFGPFAANTPLVKAVLLDVLFIVLSVTGLALAAVIAERERAEQDHAASIRRQAAMEARHRLAAMNRQLTEAQEQERSRIARELHDNIGQRLALLMLELGSRAEHRGSFAQLQASVSEIAADVHALSHNLHSSKLDVLGLATGMRMLCRDFGEQHQVRVRLDAAHAPARVPSEAALCLYRILQEALHNAAKHSGVSDLEVRLWQEGDHVHLQVRDHGAGFDLEASKTGDGIGLVSMDERIKLVHGELSIESRPQRGTTVHARVPFDPAPASVGE